MTNPYTARYMELRVMLPMTDRELDVLVDFLQRAEIPSTTSKEYQYVLGNLSDRLGHISAGLRNKR